MDEQQPAETIEETPTAVKADPTRAGIVVTQRGDWQGMALFVAGVGAAIWGLISALGSGWGLWNWTSGITGVKWSFFLALAVIVLGLLLGRRAKMGGVARPRFLRWLGMFVAIVYTGWISTFVIAEWRVPAIHDISTDLADPPSFRQLALRPDNWDEIPGATDAEMKSMTPQQRWVVVHQNGYGDIRSVRINEPVPMIIARADRLAQSRGWDVALSLPEEGRLEATDTSTFFRFKDDIVLRVRPTDTGEGSIVDMRSVSRVGVNDLGVNAKRVRSFMADLSGAVTAGQ
ncbi:MAG: DUF1499 domain-containing protein [Sphingorhabdus sp.]